MNDDTSAAPLLGPLFSTAAMRALVGDRARLQRMLDVEAALARAEAHVGVIPQSAARAIETSCRAERFDLSRIAEASAAAGNVAIPMVKALTATVKEHDSSAAGFVHWGATSQDVIDTALVLELRGGIELLLADLRQAIAAFSAGASAHRATPMAGRTWLQHALPIPFGLKLAGYASALARTAERLARLRSDALVLQFGGAAGTLAALGPHGWAVAEQLAVDLDLPLPDSPWHSHRDRLAEAAAALAILSGTCGKIGRDIALLMQTDVGEAFEPAGVGRGGSSTMPQKRNPVAAAAAVAAATIAPGLAATILGAQVQEHERAVGSWRAEWPVFPALLLAVSGGLAAIVDIAEGLEVDAERMRANIEASGGQIMAEAVAMALAAKLGKSDAHRLVERVVKAATKDRLHLDEALAADPEVAAVLTQEQIDALLDPANYLGVSPVLIDRSLRYAADVLARLARGKNDGRR